MDSKYIIIGRSSCPYCTMAQDLLAASGIEYIFLDYLNREEILEDYKAFHEQATVPIILSNHIHTGIVRKVGGYTDLLSELGDG